MISKLALTIAFFGSLSILLVYLLLQLFKLRGTKDESSGSSEHWLPGDSGGGSSDGDGGA